MTATICIDPQHPSLPGHFPGRPIVPGVVMLASIRAELARCQPGLVISGIRKLKFLRPLAPGESFVVQFAEVRNGGVRFKCMMANHESALAEGHLTVLDQSAER